MFQEWNVVHFPPVAERESVLDELRAEIEQLRTEIERLTGAAPEE